MARLRQGPVTAILRWRFLPAIQPDAIPWCTLAGRSSCSQAPRKPACDAGAPAFRRRIVPSAGLPRERNQRRTQKPVLEGWPAWHEPRAPTLRTPGRSNRDTETFPTRVRSGRQSTRKRGRAAVAGAPDNESQRVRDTAAAPADRPAPNREGAAAWCARPCPGNVPRPSPLVPPASRLRAAFQPTDSS